MFIPKFLKIFTIDWHDIMTGIMVLATLILFIPIYTYLYFVPQNFTKDYIMNRNNTGVEIYDRKGELFYRFYQAQNRTYIPLNALPDHVKNSVIVAEDREFYSHSGFSIKSIVGALIADIKHKDLKYGGSTITQQLVKNSLLHSDKNFLRKYQEVILAQEIERRFNKDEIIEMYLNSVYFGEGAFGIESAAQAYFGIPAKDLSISQASLLAGLLIAPSKLSPISGDYNLAKQRQEYVLNRLAEFKYISETEKDNAQKAEISFKSGINNNFYKAPHFALMVKDELIKKYGEETVARSGFKVYTTLDLDWQEHASKVVVDQINNLSKQKVSNGSVVVLDTKTGEILALVGSVDWFDPKFGQINMATTPRQSGSAFKPIVYLAGFEKGVITPASTLKDLPATFITKNALPKDKSYKPQNFDGKFRGPVLVRRALANSLNIPAVEVMQKVGIENVLDISHRLGISTLNDPSHYGLSLVLGTGEVSLLELTNSYATIGNQGRRNTPTTISSIIDKFNQKIYEYTPQPIGVIDPKHAYLITSILSDNKIRQEVFGNNLNTKSLAAVKTGTTEEFRGSLTVGYTTSLAIGVWIGNTDNSPMDKVAGSLGAAPIWRNLTDEFSQDYLAEKFTPPSGVIALNICRGNGLIATTATSSAQVEYFVEGTQPKKSCTPANLAKKKTENKSEDNQSSEKKDKKDEKTSESSEHQASIN